MFSTYYPLCFPEYAHFMEQKWNINNGKIMDLKNGKKMEKKPGFFFIGPFSQDEHVTLSSQNRDTKRGSRKT